jgi:hypothetical protein
MMAGCERKGSSYRAFFANILLNKLSLGFFEPSETPGGEISASYDTEVCGPLQSEMRRVTIGCDGNSTVFSDGQMSKGIRNSDFFAIFAHPFVVVAQVIQRYERLSLWNPMKPLGDKLKGENVFRNIAGWSVVRT